MNLLRFPYFELTDILFLRKHASLEKNIVHMKIRENFNIVMEKIIIYWVMVWNWRFSFGSEIS